MRNIKTYSLFLIGLLTLFAVSCKKEEYDPNFELPRQFTPGDISINAGETEAKLQWDPSLFTAGKDVTYTVQLSKDASFATIAHTQEVDTSMVVITDAVLDVAVDYFARVKANKLGNTNESYWVNSGSFKITGEQIFTTIADADIKDKTVLLKWRPYADLTKIIIKPLTGAQTEIALTAADITANQKLITGLTPQTAYTAEIYKGNIIKGKINFTTKEQSIYAVILNPGEDLIAAVNNAANGEIIGLNPGEYHSTNSNGAYTAIIISQKRITIQSTSNNPANTKVHFKEFNIKGTGAGVTLKGIEFIGTNGSADYFINFTGLAADADAATFTKVTVDNSIVRGTNNALIRGNRGGNNAHKIDSIQLRNSIFADNGSTAGFDYILLDKMEFKGLEITNSTFYNSGRRLISWATNFTAPKPSILMNYVTVNSIGYGGRDNVLLDANTNPIEFVMKNSIFANTPKPGQTVGNSLLRASNAGSSVTIANSNLFNLSNGAATPANLTIPSYVVQSNNISVDLGWTGTTTTFTLPAGSPVRTASETGGPIGDPRWH